MGGRGVALGRSDDLGGGQAPRVHFNGLDRDGKTQRLTVSCTSMGCKKRQFRAVKLSLASHSGQAELESVIALMRVCVCVGMVMHAYGDASIHLKGNEVVQVREDILVREHILVGEHIVVRQHILVREHI